MPEGFSAYSAGTRKVAFTLAEVLITLGIIGVVAAMTLPSLVNKYREQEIITRVKKTYTSIAQALELVQANYGTPGDNSSLFAKGRSSAEITKELSKYFNGARYCEAGANANFVSWQGTSPWLLAVKSGDMQKIRLLEQFNADISIQDNCGKHMLK